MGSTPFLLARSLNNSYEVDSKNLIILDLFDFSIKELSTFTHIIIAVQPRYTYKILEYILSNTTSKILVEKPVCLEISELDKLSASEFDNRIYVAFNRRFFPSTSKAKNMIGNDPVLSLQVCFTELRNRMKGSEYELKRWAILNTIHLFDMAFYLVEIPTEIKINHSENFGVKNYNVNGKLSNGFAYLNGQWGAPGNWSIIITTDKYKLFFDPLEKLVLQEKDSFKKVDLELDYSINKKFKDGFYQQTCNFINDNKSKFIIYKDYYSLHLFICKIFNY